jgi:hypothetical protein
MFVLLHQHFERIKISKKILFPLSDILREEGTRVYSTHMKESHRHIAFTDPLAAANWFKT